MEAVYNVLGPKAKTFLAVKNKVTTALILEAAYYITFVPGLLNLMDYDRFLLEMTLFASIYFLQMLLIKPFLIFLGFKIKNEIKTGFQKWATLPRIGYIAAIWVNIIFRWFFMSFQEGDTISVYRNCYIRSFTAHPHLIAVTHFLHSWCIKCDQEQKQDFKLVRAFHCDAGYTLHNLHIVYNAIGGMLDKVIPT